MVNKASRLSALRRHTGRVQRQLNQLQQQSHTLTWARLLSFLTAFIATSAAFFLSGPLSALIVGTVGFLAFLVTVILHHRLELAISRHTIWLDIKQTHIARMTLDWDSLPTTSHQPPATSHQPPATSHQPPTTSHPFAHDLDLIGSHSLHQLINTTVSPEGNERLLEWLLETEPRPDTIYQRQKQVRELSALPRFRDKLTLSARLTTDQDNKQRLLDWLNEPPPTPPPDKLWLGFAGLALVNIILYLGSQFGLLPAWWPYTLGVYLLLYFLLGREAGATFRTGLAMQSALEQLNMVFQFLETYHFAKNGYLAELCRPLQKGGQRPSRHLRQLGWVVNAAGLSQNPVMWLVLNLVVPWDIYFAHRLHQLRGNLAQHLPQWLDIWFELEALSALATLHYLNPHYTFPKLDGSDVLFNGRQLGHPLISDEQKVCNDFGMNTLGEVNILTGSNMSGKSSFLRTLGVNLALAYAGGAVDAAHLSTTWFSLFTSIRVADSVTDGISFFYAEVKRLRLLLDLLQESPRPVFFLIDEIFRGTNNQERLLGSRAFITALVGGHSVGAIATHDLELVKLADEFPAVSNYHFRDDIAGDKMIFDYTLRPGPCPTTNALKIMAAAGLPTPQPPGASNAPGG